MTSVRHLANLCRRIGARVPFWTQGPGGNVSVKVGEGLDLLYVKASGFRLDQVTPKSGIAAVKLPALTEKLPGLSPGAEKQYASLLRANALSSEVRPSMETGFHALLPKPFVLHFHSIAALLMVHELLRASKRCSEFLDARITGGWRWIRACKPGLELSHKVSADATAAVYLIENHGVILQGDDPACLNAWVDLENDFLDAFNYRQATASPSGRPTPFRLFWPDSAVFIKRLERAVEPAGTGEKEPHYRLKEGAQSADRDAAELWWATEIAFHTCPTLKPLPNAIAAVVATLPTERFRRGLAR